MHNSDMSKYETVNELMIYWCNYLSKCRSVYIFWWIVGLYQNNISQWVHNEKINTTKSGGLNFNCLTSCTAYLTHAFVTAQSRDAVLQIQYSTYWFSTFYFICNSSTYSHSYYYFDFWQQKINNYTQTAFLCALPNPSYTNSCFVEG